MALFAVPTMKRIMRVPHQNENSPILHRIAPVDMQRIEVEINLRIDAVVNSAEELITAGWIPGHDWNGIV